MIFDCLRQVSPFQFPAGIIIVRTLVKNFSYPAVTEWFQFPAGIIIVRTLADMLQAEIGWEFQFPAGIIIVRTKYRQQRTLS